MLTRCINKLEIQKSEQELAKHLFITTPNEIEPLGTREGFLRDDRTRRLGLPDAPSTAPGRTNAAMCPSRLT